MFQFKRLDAGPRWHVIATGFDRLSQGEAFARDWLAARGYDILACDHDFDGLPAIDIMTAKSGAMYQFAIEPGVVT